MRKFLALVFFSASSLASELTVIEGPWIEARRSTYRYVSTYEVKLVSTPHKSFPWIREDCHDAGDRFANWSKTISFERTYSGAINFSLLGFGFDFGGDNTETTEFTFERWIHATDGIRAKHVLYEEYEDWVGTTRVEYLQRDGSVAVDPETYPFSLRKQNYGLVVKRKDVEKCE